VSWTGTGFVNAKPESTAFSARPALSVLDLVPLSRTTATHGKRFLRTTCDSEIAMIENEGRIRRVSS
jgi:hypothetical protein